MTTHTAISATLIPEQYRITHTAQLFGLNYPFKLEPLIFHAADSLAEGYSGGLWEFYALSNGGFYMAPNTEERFKVDSPNGYICELSADALGIACCLYAYSLISFEGIKGFSEDCAEHFHRLRDFMLDHPEAGAILRVID